VGGSEGGGDGEEEVVSVLDAHDEDLVQRDGHRGLQRCEGLPQIVERHLGILAVVLKRNGLAEGVGAGDFCGREARGQLCHVRARGEEGPSPAED
jgi:hypothetical protein